jgi:ketosteroid isomerase-like protein
MTELELRVQRIEDELAIRNLVARYGILLDNRDYDAVGELYTEDAVFRHHVGFTHAQTRPGIVSFYRERLRDVGPTFHYPHGHVVELTGPTSATGIVTSHAEMGIGDTMVIVGFRYHDDYEKGSDGRWRFKSRVMWFHYFMPAKELPDRYSDEIRRTWPGDPLPADLPDSLETWKRRKDPA